MRDAFIRALKSRLLVSASVGLVAAVAYSVIFGVNFGRDTKSIYVPLDRKDQLTTEIRLLHVFPGQKGHRIKCTLEIVSLGDSLKYEALSYTWGDPERPRGWLQSSFSEDFQRWRRHYIDVNGHSVRITYNLHAALQQLRYENETRTLWVDALCINQEDTQEKSEQVQVMGDIYSRASRVLCWLGEKHWLEGLDDMTFDTIEELVFVVKIFVMKLCAEDLGMSLTEVTEERLFSFINSLESRPRSEFPALRFLSIPGMSAGFKKALSLVPVTLGNASTISDIAENTFGRSRLFALRVLSFGGRLSELQGFKERLDIVEDMFLRRNYWSRVWILQEMLKAEEATLICGDREIDIRPLLLLRVATETNSDGLGSLVPGLDAIAAAWLTRAIFYVNDIEFFRILGPLSLAQMLEWQSMARTSSDPRDAIYALLGISNPIDIAPDYSKTVAEVFIDATRKIINNEKNLNIICLSVANQVIGGDHFPGYYSGPPLPNIPSWVPHFESALNDMMMVNSYWRGNGPASPIDNSLSLNDDRILPISGCFHAIIEMVNSRGRSPHPTIKGYEWLTFVNETRMSFSKHNSASMLDADIIWRTLLMDSYEDDTGFENRLDHSIEIEENYKRDVATATETEAFPTRFDNLLYRHSMAKSLCLLADGGLALVLGDVKAGDLVFVARGAPNPFVIRPVGHDESYNVVQKANNISTFFQFIGASFVRGIMDGQVIDAIDGVNILEERVYLI